MIDNVVAGDTIKFTITNQSGNPVVDLMGLGNDDPIPDSANASFMATYEVQGGDGNEVDFQLQIPPTINMGQKNPGEVTYLVECEQGTVNVPSIAIIKSADTNPFTTVGQVITYSYLVLNNGNETLDNVTVIDNNIDGTV